jgi:hypothetical protein
MMQQIPSKLKLADEDFFGPIEWFDGGGGVLMAERQSVSYEPERFSKSVQAAVAEIEALRGKKALFVMINRLDPGIIIERHTDTLKMPYPVERWHLPVITNPKAWHEQGSRFNMTAGVWYGPVPYWEEHCGGNEGTTPRIHLIVDLETDGATVVLAVVKPAAAIKGTAPEGFNGPGRVIDLAAENRLEMSSTGG